MMLKGSSARLIDRIFDLRGELLDRRRKFAGFRRSCHRRRHQHYALHALRLR
jgi:hypothetical protein